MFFNTGTPKGAMLTHGNINATASAIQLHYQVCNLEHKTFTYQYFSNLTASAKTYLFRKLTFSSL